MSAAAASGGSEDGGGGRKSKIPPPADDTITTAEENDKRIPVAQNPITITKKRPVVGFSWGKMSSDLVMRGTLETQYSRRERGWPTAAPTTFGDDDGKIRKNHQDNKDDEANNSKK